MANNEKLGKILKCVDFVEALHVQEVANIINCDDGKHLYVVVDPHMVRDFPKSFLWKDDPKVIEGIKEACNGPYKFLVLLFKNEEANATTTEATIGAEGLSEEDEPRDFFPGGFIIPRC